MRPLNKSKRGRSFKELDTALTASTLDFCEAYLFVQSRPTLIHIKSILDALNAIDPIRIRHTKEIDVTEANIELIEKQCGCSAEGGQCCSDTDTKSETKSESPCCSD